MHQETMVPIGTILTSKQVHIRIHKFSQLIKAPYNSHVYAWALTIVYKCISNMETTRKLKASHQSLTHRINVQYTNPQAPLTSNKQPHTTHAIYSSKQPTVGINTHIWNGNKNTHFILGTIRLLKKSLNARGFQPNSQEAKGMSKLLGLALRLITSHPTKCHVPFHRYLHLHPQNHFALRVRSQAVRVI